MSTTTINPVLEIKRVFDATPERVFDAWLIREEWQAWIGPEGVQCDVPLLEPRVGGRYSVIMHMSDGKQIRVAGEFKAIERPSRFVFTWGWEGDPTRTTLVTVTLKAAGGKTEMMLRHEGLSSAEDRESHGKGWNSTLNKLAAYLHTPSGLRT
jgi:uncharacterized protein YndB with AHSA1/START domain